MGLPSKGTPGADIYKHFNPPLTTMKETLKFIGKLIMAFAFLFLVWLFMWEMDALGVPM